MSGVCGKKPDVAAVQDLLVYVTKGISAVTTALRQEGKQVSAEINHLITLNPVSYTHLDVYKRQDLQSGTGFSYSVEEGTITYADGYAGGNLGLFGSDQVRFPIEVSYQSSSDMFAAGLTGTYFYIKDTNGNPVSNVQLSLSGTGEPIGISDADGKILYEPIAAGTITVQAVGSFPYTVTVNEPGGESTGAPEMILHNACLLSTSRCV